MSYLCAECNHLGCKKGDLTQTMTCCPSKDEAIQAQGYYRKRFYPENKG